MSPDPTIPEHLTIEYNFALYAPRTEVSLEEAVEMISGVIMYCVANGITGLLIDARQLFGFPHPSVVDRYWFIRKWAAESGGKVVMSMISRPEMIDPDQIGITIAANAGMTVNVFADEPEAREWLIANIPKSTTYSS